MRAEVEGILLVFANDVVHQLMHFLVLGASSETEQKRTLSLSKKGPMRHRVLPSVRRICFPICSESTMTIDLVAFRWFSSIRRPRPLHPLSVSLPH
jgi:hypothetical protein